MTANELAGYFEVSERTIYRDIDALSQLHVPIVSYEGVGGGYEIDPSYFIPSIKLNEKEILILLMLLKAGEEFRIPNMTTDYNLLSGKLINVLSDEERGKAEQVISHIEFDIIRIMPKGYIHDVLTPLLEAFWKSCDLQIGYHHPERDETELRRFSPVILFFENGGWYLAGYCHVRQEKRTFRLDRIVSITCLEEENLYLNRPLSLPQNDRFLWHTYELIIDPTLYRVIKDDVYLQNADIKSTNDGLHLTVKTPFKSEICKLVLSHPKQVTALKPEEFLKEIEELSKAIYKKYFKP
jgi:predicted DNA-binding transcriptional regulator YafY